MTLSLFPEVERPRFEPEALGLGAQVLHGLALGEAGRVGCAAGRVGTGACAIHADPGRFSDVGGHEQLRACGVGE